MGGGAKSDLWLQMKADVLGLAVERVAEPETALLGDAVFAGLGAGVWPDAESAVRQVAKRGGGFEPDPARADAYREARQRYRDAYTCLYG